MSIVKRSNPARWVAPLALSGQSLLVLSAVAFSTAGFFARQAPVNPWAMIFWRNVFGVAVLLVPLLAAPATFGRVRLRLDRRNILVVTSGAFATVCYLAAFAYTSVANIAIIYATAPMITSVLAWLWLGEAISRRTLLAALVALVGVGVTVAGSGWSGSILGDGLALIETIGFSVMAVAARGTAPQPLPTALLTSLLAAFAVLPLGSIAGASFVISWRDAAWLAAFGAVAMAVALPCYFLGAARMPAGRAMLIGALELPLSPLWVWLAFDETPSVAAMIGGLIVTCAVVSDVAGRGSVTARQ